MNPMTVELEAYQVIEKGVKSSGNSGRVYVPKEWIGKKVKVLLLEPLE
jgi:putative transposon-encoded protein